MHTTPTPETHYLAAVIVLVALPRDEADDLIPEGVEPLAWVTQRVDDVAREAGIAVIATDGVAYVENVGDLIEVPAPWEA